MNCPRCKSSDTRSGEKKIWHKESFFCDSCGDIFLENGRPITFGTYKGTPHFYNKICFRHWKHLLEDVHDILTHNKHGQCWFIRTLYRGSFWLRSE